MREQQLIAEAEGVATVDAEAGSTFGGGSALAATTGDSGLGGGISDAEDGDGASSTISKRKVIKIHVFTFFSKIK